ncbi:MAG: hypothetical protein KA035_03425 [Candidatus Levybacteria bacterium]|nr:hypothetical protein [Candidatus Levybacteria bacterium]
MRSNYKILFADRVIVYAFIVSILGILFLIGLSGFQFLNLPPVIPLFNSLPWGEERLVAKWLIFVIPAFLIGILFLNLFLASKLYRRNALLSRIFLFNTLLGVGLSGIALTQVMFLIF